MVPGLVSVIMPSYNTGRFIAESIGSVLAQTYTNWELLIVDDASTDNTDEVVQRVIQSVANKVCHPERSASVVEGSSTEEPYQRIRYIKNDRNRGAAYSRNLALREANGEWIAFLDSDDLWLPEKLEKQLKFMNDNGYKFSGTGRVHIDEDDNPLNRYIRSPHHVGKLGMFLYCWPGCLTVIYHAPTVGLVQIADLKKNNDYAIWLKVVKKCDFYAFDEVLSKYRVRKKSISHDSFKKLVKSHYDLFRVGESMNPVSSFVFACLNMLFGAWKKIKYVEKLV